MTVRGQDYLLTKSIYVYFLVEDWTEARWHFLSKNENSNDNDKKKGKKRKHAWKCAEPKGKMFF